MCASQKFLDQESPPTESSHWDLWLNLGPYDHLSYIYRLCKVHGFRNIEKQKVDEFIKDLMKCVWCVRHPSLDETLETIKTHNAAGAGT